MCESLPNRRRFLTGSGAMLVTGIAAMPGRCRATELNATSEAPSATRDPGPQQSEEGVVYHHDAYASDLMKGFPPPRDRRVTTENWNDTTDTLRWMHLHGNVVVKMLPVDRGGGPVWVLPRQMLDPDKFGRAEVLWGKSKSEARRIPISDWLRRSETDAIVVLHEGQIVAEQYFGAMTPSTPHRMWSASKSVLASILAPLLHDGAVDERAAATQYVPELSSSGLAGATVRQMLDMFTGVYAPCFPNQAELGTQDEATRRKWTLGTPEFRRADHEFARLCRAMRAFPGVPGEETTGCYDYLLTTRQDREHGKYFYYTDPNPIALQWIIERTTNISYVEHLSRMLQSLGAESNGLITLDAIGSAVSSVGLSLTARDFARWGLMLCNGGRLGTGHVVAGVGEFVDDIRRNPGPERWNPCTNAIAWAPENTGYRSLMWATPAESGKEPISYAGGAFYQGCYVDAMHNNVLVKFSSFLSGKPGRPAADDAAQNESIAAQSLLEDVLPHLLG